MRTLRMLLVMGAAVVLPVASTLGSDDADPKPTAGPVKVKSTSELEITPYSGGNLVVRTVNRTYDFIDYGGGGLLLRQEIETKRFPPPREGWATAAVRVTAFDIGPNGKQSKRYQIVERGQEGRLLDRDRYQITMFGCCDSLNALVIYNPRTGKPVLYASGWDAAQALAKVKLPDESTSAGQIDRWIGVYTNDAPYDDVVFGPGSKGARAIVTYATDDAPLARALIDLEPPRASHYQVEKIELRPGSVVRIEFIDEVVVEIPIKLDKLDVARAKLPPGATAKLLPAAWTENPGKADKPPKR